MLTGGDGLAVAIAELVGNVVELVEIDAECVHAVVGVQVRRRDLPWHCRPRARLPGARAETQRGSRSTIVDSFFDLRARPSPHASGAAWVSTFFESTALLWQHLRSVSWIASSRLPCEGGVKLDFTRGSWESRPLVKRPTGPGAHRGRKRRRSRF